MAAGQLPNGMQTFLDANGNPLAGGSVEFYIPATLTPKNTWQDEAQSTLNINPVPLDSAGRAVIFGLGAYRQIVKDSLGNTIWDRLTYDPSFNAGSAFASVPFLAQGPDGTPGQQAQSAEDRAGWIFDAADYNSVIYADSAHDSGPGLSLLNIPAGSRILVRNQLYVKTNTTIAANLYFQGGNISVDVGVTVSYTGKVVAEAGQNIFGGLGTHNLSAADIVDVSAQWFGAKGNGTTDDTTAIQNALNTGFPVQFLSLTYLISAALNCNYNNDGKSNKLRGAARGKSIIQQNTDGLEILKVGGQGAQVENLSLTYTNRQTVTGAKAVSMKDVSQGLFSRIRAVNAFYCCHLTAGVITNTVFREWICKDFKGSMFNIIGSGTTSYGLVFQSIFGESLDAGGSPQSLSEPQAFYLDTLNDALVSGLIIQNLKVLRCVVGSSIQNFVLQAVHLQNITPNGGDNSGFFVISAGSALISGIGIENCSVLVGNIPTSYACFKVVAAAKLVVDSMIELGGTRTTGTWEVVNAASGTVVGRITEVTVSAAINGSPGTVTADYPYNIMQYGRQLWWFRFGSGQKIWIDGLRAAAPASGTWAVGDTVWNSDPVSGGFMGWVCTTAGSPGTWKTFGVIS